MSNTSVKAYKGFNRDMTCRDFHYAPGETYEEPVAKLCQSGFHACIAPVDCLRYYAPGTSVFREVELDGVSDQRDGNDTKIVGKKIKIGAEIGIPGICKAQFEYVKSNTNFEHTDPKQATAGNHGAATAGDSGAATAGDMGAATAGGRSKVGENGVAVAYGYSCYDTPAHLCGGLGSTLIAVDKDDTSKAICAITKIVDGENIKPDTWYVFRNGELVEDTDHA